jgi:GTPase SAR1 family protein
MYMLKVKCAVIGDDVVYPDSPDAEYRLKFHMLKSYYDYMKPGSSLALGWTLPNGEWSVDDTVDGISVHLDLAEIVENESAIRKMIYTQIHPDVFIIVFSLVSLESFNHAVHQWADEISEFIREHPTISILLAGGQVDLHNGRKITCEQGIAAAKEIGALGYYEFSEHDGKALVDLFRKAIRLTPTYEVYKNQRKIEKSQGTFSKWRRYLSRPGEIKKGAEKQEKHSSKSPGPTSITTTSSVQFWSTGAVLSDQLQSSKGPKFNPMTTRF